MPYQFWITFSSRPRHTRIGVLPPERQADRDAPPLWVREVTAFTIRQEAAVNATLGVLEWMERDTRDAPEHAALVRCLDEPDRRTQVTQLPSTFTDRRMWRAAFRFRMRDRITWVGGDDEADAVLPSEEAAPPHPGLRPLTRAAREQRTPAGFLPSAAPPVVSLPARFLLADGTEYRLRWLSADDVMQGHTGLDLVYETSEDPPALLAMESAAVWDRVQHIASACNGERAAFEAGLAELGRILRRERDAIQTGGGSPRLIMPREGQATWFAESSTGEEIVFRNNVIYPPRVTEPTTVTVTAQRAAPAPDPAAMDPEEGAP